MLTFIITIIIIIVKKCSLQDGKGNKFLSRASYVSYSLRLRVLSLGSLQFRVIIIIIIIIITIIIISIIIIKYHYY